MLEPQRSLFGIIRYHIHTVLASMRLCHPDAVKFRKNYNANKEELGEILYKLFNDKIFDGKLNTPISWNKKLQTTAGRCCQRKTK